MKSANDQPTGIIEKLKLEKERFIRGWNVPDEQKLCRNICVSMLILTIIFVIIYPTHKNRPEIKPLTPISLTPPSDMPEEQSIDKVNTPPLPYKGSLSHEQ